MDLPLPAELPPVRGIDNTDSFSVEDVALIIETVLPMVHQLVLGHHLLEKKDQPPLREDVDWRTLFELD